MLVLLFGSCHLFVLFLMVIPNPVAFLLNVTSTVMFWMSACQSILCTVHLTWSLCYPNGSFMVCLCGRVIDWFTSNLPRQCSPHDMLNVCTCLKICLWLVGVHGLLEDDLSEPNSSEKQKKAVNWCFQTRLQFSLTFQCAAMMYYCRIFMNMNGVTFFNSKLMFCVIRYNA